MEVIMDYTLTEEQQQLLKLVEEFVERDVKPYWEKQGYEEFPWPLFRKLGEIGLAAIPFAPEYGGGGLGFFAHAIILEKIKRARSHLGGGVPVVRIAPPHITPVSAPPQQRQGTSHAVPRATLST